MENFNTPSTKASGIGALAANSPSGLVMADDHEPNGFSRSLPNQKRDRRGDYVLVETSEEADLGRDPHNKVKDDMEGVPAVPTPSGMEMAGTPEVSPSRNARPFEVRDDAYSGLLAR
eukprot:3336182-Pleurochrysis_carterae.AAC.1